MYRYIHPKKYSYTRKTYFATNNVQNVCHKFMVMSHATNLEWPENDMHYLVCNFNCVNESKLLILTQKENKD